MSKIPDVQEAVRRLSGVASASVRWPDPLGPATLRVEFAPGADHAQVTQEVLEALRDIGGADTDSLEVRLSEPGDTVGAAVTTPAQSATATAGTGTAAVPGRAVAAEAADPGAARTSSAAAGADLPAPADGRLDRPIFTAMLVERGQLDTNVEVVLELSDRRLTGRAEGLTTRDDVVRTAASAALSALREILPERVRLQLDWLEIADPGAPGRPQLVHASVICLTPAGEETYVGAAMVRGDLREAAVRATLDAVNRRLLRLLEQTTRVLAV